MEFFAVEEVDEVVVAACFFKALHYYFWVAEIGDAEEGACEGGGREHVGAEEGSVDEFGLFA